MRKIFLYIWLLLFSAGCVAPLAPSLRIVSPGCHGQDILGLARQDVKMISNNWEDGECLGVLAGTFGGTIKPVKRIISENIVPAVRWHLSFCNHGSQCLQGECLPTDLNCMKKKAKDINALHEQYPGTKCYISPRLEYTENNCTKVQSWFNAVEAVAPLCTLVASPLFGSCIPGEVLVERHGNNPSNVDIVSNDGSNIFDSNSVWYNTRGSVINFKWTNRNNLRLTSEHGSVLPPRDRPLSNRLGKKDLKHMQLIKKPISQIPPAPALCNSIKHFSGKDLYKTHAEDYGAGNDGKGNNPLLITKNGPGDLNVYNPNGKKIGCFRYYGSYTDPGYNRHYMGSCSGDHAVDLYKKANSDWAFVKEGNACRPISILHRMGYFLP